MADVGGDSGGGGGARHQKKRAKKGTTRIDMTPMVDLAFLLLTFFILTTTMYKPSTLQLTFPVPDTDKQQKPTKVNNALTLFLTKRDQILYYKNEFKPGETQLTRTDFSQIRPMLIDLNKTTFDRVQEYGREYNANKINKAEYDSLKNEAQKAKDALFVIIKPDEDAKYRNMIDMVDEMDIAGIGQSAVQDSIKPAEETLLDAEKLKF